MFNIKSETLTVDWNNVIMFLRLYVAETTFSILVVALFALNMKAFLFEQLLFVLVFEMLLTAIAPNSVVVTAKVIKHHSPKHTVRGTVDGGGIRE